MRKPIFRRLTVLTWAAIGALTACVDNDYDLSDIDLTIKVGSDTIVMPASSTGDIILDNIFDLAADGPITKIGELYYLDEGDEASVDPIDVGGIHISRPAVPGFSSSIVFQSGADVKKLGAPDNQSIFSYSYIIDDEQATTSITQAEARDISADLVEINRIGIDRARFTFRLETFGDNLDVVHKIHYSSFQLQLPKGLEIGRGDINGVPLNLQKATDEGLVTTDDEITLSPSEPILITLDVDAAQVREGYGVQFDASRHYASLSGDIKLSGTVLLTNEDFDLQLLIQRLWQKAAILGAEEVGAMVDDISRTQDLSTALSLLIPAIDFSATGEFDRDLEVQTFSGHIRHSVKDINSITINDLPDFLEGDDVHLDLDNPQLYLDVFTDIPSQVHTDLSLVPGNNGVEDTSRSVTVDDITYDGARGAEGMHKLFILSKRDIAVSEMPEEYQQANRYDYEYVTADVGQLIYRIPDEIKVKGSKQDEIVIDLPYCEDVPVNTTYDVQLRYRVYSSLSFGPDFQIVYRKTEGGWDLGEDVDNLDFSSLSIEARATSDLPLSIALSVVPLNKEGEEITDLEVLYRNGNGPYQSNSLSIRAQADGSDADKIAIMLRAANGRTLGEFLKPGPQQLDGIRYEARLHQPSAANAALMTTSNVRLTDVHINILGGIIVEDE